jgi:hypothetical protein
MSNLRTIIITLTFTTFLAGCGGSEKSIAIEDYIVGADYEIVKVDDQPAERAKSWLLVTVIPLALVSEGTHHLTVRHTRLIDFTRKKDTPEDFTISVKKGKGYRIIRKNGKPFLVERSDK